MKVLQVNATFGIGSTGKIMSDLSKVITDKGFESYMLCAYSNVKQDNLYVMSKLPYPWNARLNILRMMLTGMNGQSFYNDTKKAIHWIEKINPDIMHIHNIHGDWINIEVLFEFIIQKNIPVLWTFHDCWPFTGRCSHFELAKCQKWKKQCFECKNLSVYPTTIYFDYSYEMYKQKKGLFSKIPQLSIVTPSKWLADYVKQSYFSCRSIDVIHNGIDIKKYKVIESVRNNKKNKKILLGVANSWSETKGLKDFYKLNEIIDHNKYEIMLVGLNDRQLNSLPKSIKGIKRTNSEAELIDLYNEAFVFINPTYQDNYPTTNLEAMSCGTPVITYNTGGCSESINNTTGFVVEQGDIEGLYRIVRSMANIDYIECSRVAKSYCDKNICFEAYIKKYNDIYEVLTKC